MCRSDAVPRDSTPSVQLPPELWIIVLSQIQPGPKTPGRDHVIARLDIRQRKNREHEVLQEISLTCRSLHDLALPIRFRHVKIHADENKGAKPTELYLRLSKSEKLRSFVKVASLLVYGKGLPRLPDSAQDIMCGMHNLEDLRMRTPFQMTTPLYSHICSLQSLRHLRITMLRQSGSGSFDIAPISHQLSIRSLSIVYGGTRVGYGKLPSMGWPPHYAWLIPPWLAPIALSSNIRHLCFPSHAIILPSIGSSPRAIAAPSPNLITLEVNAPCTTPEWEEFRQFIGLSPLITNLILNERLESLDDTELDPLPQKLLPGLRRFEGSLRFAGLVVPGRPVSTLVLSSMLLDEIPSQFRPLTLSTTAIRSINIRSSQSLGFIAMIVGLFPDLEEFHMIVDPTNAQVCSPTQPLVPKPV